MLSTNRAEIKHPSNSRRGIDCSLMGATLVLEATKLHLTPASCSYKIQLFQLRLSPEQSGKVEYERERLLGIANKFIQLK
jgi:hypothetical protein